MKPQRVKVPKGLGPEGKRLFRLFVAQFSLESDDRALHFLAIACEQYERMKAAEQAISEQGGTVRDRYGGQKLNPMLAVETRARREHITALREATREGQAMKRVPIAQRRAKTAKDAANVTSLELARRLIKGDRP